MSIFRLIWSPRCVTYNLPYLMKFCIQSMTTLLCVNFYRSEICDTGKRQTSERISEVY